MRPAIAVIDAALVLKGRTVLADMERCSREPDKANEALLMKILRENADTEYGKKYGFADIHSAEEYKKRVPYSDYDVYAPYIQRMVKNKETNLITAYNVIQYAETSGSVGVQKKIPVTDRSMAVYEKYSFARTKAIASKHYHAKYHRPVPFEKGLNTLETETTVMDDGTPRGSVTGSVSRRFRKLFPLFLTSPDPVLFPIGGSFDIEIDDGARTVVLHMDDPSLGVYIPPLVWCRLGKFTPHAACISLASEEYRAEDYIHDYDEFMRLRNEDQESRNKD